VATDPSLPRRIGRLRQVSTNRPQGGWGGKLIKGQLKKKGRSLSIHIQQIRTNSGELKGPKNFKKDPVFGIGGESIGLGSSQTIYGSLYTVGRDAGANATANHMLREGKAA